MTSKHLSDRLIEGAEAVDAYRNNLMYRNIVNAVRAADEYGGDSVAVLRGCILHVVKLHLLRNKLEADRPPDF